MRKVSEFFVDGKLNVVTHNGIMHTDDLFSYALITLIMDKKYPEIEIVLTRTRDESQVPFGALVFDVFNNEFDHHDKDQTQIDGRKLASFGKLFRAFKEEVCEVFDIDYISWSNIDQNLVKFVDHTDNTGEMNPLSFAFNGIVQGTAVDPAGDDSFTMISSIASMMLRGVLYKEHQATKDRAILESLPVENINGKRIAIKLEPGYLSTDPVQENLDGIIIRMGDDEVAGKWMIKMFNGLSVTKSGLRNEGDIIFTHPNGFMGKANTLEAIKSVI